MFPWRLEHPACAWGSGDRELGPITRLLSSFAVEQVANVVLYSSDYYVKPVAMEETQ